MENRLRFRPRKTFNADLKRLAALDANIVDEVRTAIEILLAGESLPDEFNDHPLQRRLSGYREFHLRDTPLGKQPTDNNDILVVYTIDQRALVLIGIRIGSHERLFPAQNRSTK
ncbi:type II toxin-antitoxin system YafQ family toxin [Levilactobacillus enshiensis]|uniref:type II toxin-antitoxin system YafQ family toxin n=1 Tax=Levilactobacillus enshiensis TaxID=2590213 RepID=UPI00117AA06C|nr:type II toxin-antitoxin system YafQ family toxin [Levilactobacillus enshiensis]